MTSTDGPAGSRALSVSRWCLYLIVVVVPLFSIGGFVGPLRLGPALSDGELLRVVALQVLTFAGLASWAIAWARAETAPRWHRVAWGAVAYAAWSLLSAMLAVSLAVGVFGTHGRLQGLLTVTAYAGAFLLTLQVIDSAAQVRRLARVVMFTGAGLAAYGLLQWVGLDPLTWSTAVFDSRMAFSTLRNPDMLGGYLVAPLAVSAGLFFSARDRREEVVSGVALGVIAAGLLATFVRGAWLGAFAATVVFVVALLRSGVRPQRAQWGLVAGAAAVLLAIALSSAVSSSGDTNIVDRVTSAFETDRGSVGSRLLIWRSAADAIAEGRVTGEGPDQFVTAYVRHEDPRTFVLAGDLSYADNAHNMPLHLAVTVGVPGALLLIGFVGWGLVASTGMAFAREKGRAALLYAGTWSAVAGYSVYLLSGVDTPSSASLMWLLLAVLLSPGARTARFEPPRALAVGVAVVAGVLALAFALQGVARIAADAAYYESQRQTIPPHVALAAAERAAGLQPWEPEYRRAVAVAAERVVRAADPSLLPDPATALERGERALDAADEFAPGDFRTSSARSALRLAAASAIAPDRADAAAESAREAIERRPASPAGHGQLAIALSTAGDTAGAVEAARDAVGLWDGYVEGWITIALLSEQAGRTDEALEAFSTALDVMRAGDERRPAVEAAIAELQGASAP